MSRDPSYPDAKSKTPFQDGMEFQDFVCDVLARRGIVLQNYMSKRYQFECGENLQGFEIKKDELCTTTNRLSIEIAEKSRASMPEWTPSGIMRKDNSWLYIQGNRSILFIFAKSILLACYERRKEFVVENRPTIRSFFIEFEYARRIAACVIEPELPARIPLDLRQVTRESSATKNAAAGLPLFDAATGAA